MVSVVLNLMRDNENWKEILEGYDIRIKEQDNLALLMYEQSADFSNPYVKECRGMIIDTTIPRIVCRAFDKFCNYGEPYADEIDWDTAEVQEKLDGSIIKLWYYGGCWHLSTNGTIDAFEAVNPEGHNFGDMALNAFLAQRADFFQRSNTDLNPAFTYIFELVSPDNQIVVQYDQTRIVHIGTRSNATGKEYDTNIGIEKPRKYNLHSLDECIEFANKFKGSEYEGFVVVDAEYNRVKVKSEDWIRLHHMAGNSILTVDNMIDIIQNNEIDEYCNYFPNKRQRLEEALMQMHEEQLAISAFVAAATEDNFETKKEYAIKYKGHRYFHFLMEYLSKSTITIDKKYWKEFLNG